MDLRPIDLAVLAAVGREAVDGQARHWWLTGPDDPVLAVAGILSGNRVTGRVRRLQRAGVVEVADPPGAGQVLARLTGSGERVLAEARGRGLGCADRLQIEDVTVCSRTVRDARHA